jgi:hypothetical protein
MGRVEHGSPIGDEKLPNEVLDGDHGENELPLQEYSVERVEAVYRKIDLRIIPGTSRLLVFLHSQRLTKSHSLLGPLLSRLGHPLQHWHRANHE